MEGCHKYKLYQISSAWLESRVHKGDKEAEKVICAKQESNLQTFTYRTTALPLSYKPSLFQSEILI